MVTVAELKKELDARGIKYKSSDRKADLMKKLGRSPTKRVSPKKTPKPKASKCKNESQGALNKMLVDAANRANLKGVRYALRCGADPTYNKNDAIKSIFHYYGDDVEEGSEHEKNFIAIVKALLKAGANPNATTIQQLYRDQYLMTPILLQTDNLNVLKLLLKHGAYMYATNQDGQKITELSKDKRVIEYFYSRGKWFD